MKEIKSSCMVYIFILCVVFTSLANGVDDQHYVGCFSHYGNHYFLRQAWVAGYLDSVDGCISACISMKYTHAQLRNGGICSCSDGFMYYQHNEQACTQPCQDNNTQICGAKNNYWESVYKAECPIGYYGITSPVCSERCVLCPDAKPCDTSTGWCQSKIQALSSAKYLGCYHMTASDRLFELWGVWSDHGNVFTCIYTCIKHGYTHAGLRNGDYCVCGQGLPVEERRINEEQCKNPCSKNQTQTCGSQDGEWISVYRAACTPGYWGTAGELCAGTCAECLGGKQCRLSDGACPTTSVDDSRYVGCFSSYPRRILSNYSESGFGNVTQCINSCIGNGYIYAGLEDGYCRCGNVYGDFGRDETQCTFRCPNDQERTCGSEEWTSIYRAVCPIGYWGVSSPRCSNKCGHCIKDEQCDMADGGCPSGCKDGWGNKPWCNITITSSTTSSVLKYTLPSDDSMLTSAGDERSREKLEESKGIPTYAIVLIVIVLILLLVIAAGVVAVIVWKRRMHEKLKQVSNPINISQSGHLNPAVMADAGDEYSEISDHAVHSSYTAEITQANTVYEDIEESNVNQNQSDTVHMNRAVRYENSAYTNNGDHAGESYVNAALIKANKNDEYVNVRGVTKSTDGAKQYEELNMGDVSTPAPSVYEHINN